MPAMDHHVHVREQGLQRGVFVREQIEGFDPFEGVAQSVHLLDVDKPQLVALPERRQELACYVACGACQEDTPALLCMRIVHFVEGQESSPWSGIRPPYLLTIAGLVHREPLSASVPSGVEYLCLEARGEGDGKWTPTRSS